MNKPVKIRVLIAVLLLVSLCFAGIAAADDRQVTEYNGQPCVDNCLIIKCDLSTQEGTDIANSVTVLDNFNNFVPGMMLIKTPDGMTVSEAVTCFENKPGVLFAEPDYIVEVPEDEAVPAEEPVLMFSSSSPSNDTFPNDPRFDEQWALKKMNVPEAWDIETGSSDVVVAVVDSGVNYNHVDLVNRMWDDGNGHCGYDFQNNDNDPMDDFYHGTHVAGIIGAQGNNGKCISGVSQNVRIMAVKVVNEKGGGDLKNIANGIRYATEHNANIINLSLGINNQESDAIKEAIIEAGNQGILVVAAAGNNSDDNDIVKTKPSSYESDALISVAALDRNNNLASYSNFGSYTVDVAAPGGGIPYDLLSLSHTDNQGCFMMSGTSMAAPMVSGLAALLLAKNPDLTPVQVKCIIMGTVTEDEELNGKVVTGGRVNAGEALRNISQTYHLVKFYDNTGEIGSQVVKDGDPLSPASGPQVYFKILEGWYTESGTKWDFSTEVTGSMNLYAKWVDDPSVPADTSWYEGHEEDAEYHISTAAQLLGLSKIVYLNPATDPKDVSTFSFYGKTIYLDSDIDLSETEWIPIGINGVGGFAGTFDGYCKTISGLTIDLPDQYYVGLFGVSAGTIQNLTLKASEITGYKYVGTLCGEDRGSTLNNVDVFVDRVTGKSYVGGIIGKRTAASGLDADVSITVTDGIHAPGDYVGGAIGSGSCNSISVAVSGGIDAQGSYVGGAIGSGSGNTISVTVSGGIHSQGSFVGGAIGYGSGNTISVTVSDGIESQGSYVGGAIGSGSGNAITVTVSGGIDAQGNYVGGAIGSGSGNAISVTVSGGIHSQGTFVGGAIGYGFGNTISVTVSDGIESQGSCVGGAIGHASADFHDVSVAVSSISGNQGVGGIAGKCYGNISSCSAVVGSLTAVDFGGGAFGYYIPWSPSGSTPETELAVKDIFVSVNGNVLGGAIGYLNIPGNGSPVTVENVLVTGSITSDEECGGVIGYIHYPGSPSETYTVTVKHCVSLTQNISSTDAAISGRIYGSTSGMVEVSAADNYGWEGTVNSSGETFEPSEKNGSDVLTSEVWNNQSFFEKLGWDFTSVWQMNAGNNNFKLPVLQNTVGTGKLNAAYMAPQKTGSSSVTSFFGTKDGSDFTFKRAVVITEATLPGASYATVINTSGSGWYTCNLSTEGFSGTGVLYFQVPLDVIDIKGYTVNDVSVSDAKTTYLSSDNQYAYYSAVITKDGALTIDFEKDAAQKAVETKPVTETKTVETPVTTASVTTETTPVPETAAKTPFPVLGILAGLGIAGLVALRRK